jgi:hypothetical protein
MLSVPYFYLFILLSKSFIAYFTGLLFYQNTKIELVPQLVLGVYQDFKIVTKTEGKRFTAAVKNRCLPFFAGLRNCCSAVQMLHRLLTKKINWLKFFLFPSTIITIQSYNGKEGFSLHYRQDVVYN